jgi:hypothetical protein
VTDLPDSPRRAAIAFNSELCDLIDRYRTEWHLSYAEAIGCLFMRAHSLAAETRDAAQADDEPEDETEP